MPSNKKSKSSKQNSSTRLPPKTQQKKKTQASEKQAKVNIKKILMDEREDQERLKDNLHSSTECLVMLLMSGGVPKAQTSDIQKQLLAVFGSDDDESAPTLVEMLERVIISLSEATKVIETSWSYCLCFPSLDVSSIAKVLDELQTVLCENASLANKPLQRKLASLQADAKADEKVLLELEEMSKRMNGKIYSSILSLYHMY